MSKKYYNKMLATPPPEKNKTERQKKKPKDTGVITRVIPFITKASVT